MKFNRRDYMAGLCDHQTYYGQFATPAVSLSDLICTAKAAAEKIRINQTAKG